MYTIDIPHSTKQFLKESNCNKEIVQVDVTIGAQTFLGYLEMV